jgi:two-component system NtrC family sensor kinase
MAAGVAHEFGNMMNIVWGSLEQARRHPSSERQAEQLARAEWGATQAERLTRQMLNFAHRQAPASKLADLGELVRNMNDLIKQVAGIGIALTVDAPPEPLPVLVVAGQLELALFNLVQNATDAMPEGGALKISTRRLNKGDAKEFAVLEVADTGGGMAPEVARRATEPFFTTKGRGKGTGLGLSMVRDCAEQSGGRLEIDSTMGQGTRIRIVLPLSKDSAGES